MGRGGRGQRRRGTDAPSGGTIAGRGVGAPAGSGQTRRRGRGASGAPAASPRPHQQQHQRRRRRPEAEVARTPPPRGDGAGRGPDHPAAEGVRGAGGDTSCGRGRPPPPTGWKRRPSTGSNRDHEAEVQEIGTLMKRISLWYSEARGDTVPNETERPGPRPTLAAAGRAPGLRGSEAPGRRGGAGGLCQGLSLQV